MAVKKPKRLNKKNGTYQVTFKGAEKELLERILVSNDDGPILYVTDLVRSLLNVAFYHYFKDKEKFIEHYGATFFHDYFAKLDSLREKGK
jgi:hypothetical protein